MIFVGFLLFSFTSSSSNYQNMNITKTQRIQDIFSKPGQNPTIGESMNNPLPIESDQNETFKTQLVRPFSSTKSKFSKSNIVNFLKFNSKS